MSSNDFTGYILAGGKSSRMGADKAFLNLNGETFIERAVNSLKSNCAAVKIVLNRSQNDFINQLPAEISPVYDVHENRGALGGIHAALKDCPTKFAIILAVDLPNVTAEAIGSLANSAFASNKFAAVVPRQTDDRLQPLCAVYLARYSLPTLEQIIAANENASVSDFLEQIYARTIPQNNLTANAAEDLLFNVNCREDYQKLDG